MGLRGAAPGQAAVRRQHAARRALGELLQVAIEPAGAVFAPASTTFATNASWPPALIWPGKTPLVEPATKRPAAPSATPASDSVPAVPNWPVQIGAPEATYFRTHPSWPPPLV